MIKIIQEIKHCKSCGCLTLYQKNATRINWLMHVILLVITAGAWLPFLILILLFHPLSVAKFELLNNWLCMHYRHN